MSTEGSTASGNPKKTKPKPRARRTKSEIPYPQSLTVAGDDTDPSPILSSEDISAEAATGATFPDNVNESIRPRSSSRRRAYIIKRPQSAPIFGHMSSRPFATCKPGESSYFKSSPVNCHDLENCSSGVAASLVTSNETGIQENLSDSLETCSATLSDSATKLPASESHSLLCHHIEPSAVSPSFSSVICYGETKHLQKENNVDRKEHFQVFVSETFYINSIESNSKSQSKSDSLGGEKKFSSFSGKDDDSLPSDRSVEANVADSQLYAQVIKPKAAVVEVSLNLDNKDFDDFIQSPAGMSTARNDPIFEKKRTSGEILRNSHKLEGEDIDFNTQDCILQQSSQDASDDIDKTFWCKEHFGSRGDRGWCNGNTFQSCDGNTEGYSTQGLDLCQSLTKRDSDVVVPHLRLDSLTQEGSFSSEASQSSEINPEESQEFLAQMIYANFDAVPTNAGSLSLLTEKSENFELGDRSLTDGSKDIVDTSKPGVKEEVVLDSRKTSLIFKNQQAPSESHTSIGTNESIKVALRQQIALETNTKTKTPKVESAMSMPVKKLSVEYTDSVELHSSNILQAGGVAHDSHETVSSVLSEDTDSEETHRVKKRQHNPLKRLFARKKGKYSPSLNIDPSQYILPTLENENEKLKKEKSLSPKLFKRKKKAKFLSSESELSPSDESSLKQNKELKKKHKTAKLTKENIIVIKSSGKSLSDSMPEHAKVASPGADNKNAENVLEERIIVTTHDGKNVLSKDNEENAQSTKEVRHSQYSQEVKNDFKRPFYENVLLEEAAIKNLKITTDEIDDKSVGIKENLAPKGASEFHILSADVEGDSQTNACSFREVAVDNGPDMARIHNRSKKDNNEKGGEEIEEVYANSLIHEVSLMRTDRSIDLEPQYDRPPRKEMPHDNVCIAVDILNMPRGDDQEVSCSMDLPRAPKPNPDIECRKTIYLYRDQSQTTENDDIEMVKSSKDTPCNSKAKSYCAGTVSNDLGLTDEASCCSEGRRVLTSIETTESDNEPDEKLMNAMAAENPLRRPKYAMTRLQAHLLGKPMTQEPFLMESRYAEKEKTEEDLEMPVPQPKLTARKKRAHKDRIERGDISLEDASVLDTSGLDLSLRSDVSSGTATDSDITPNFDAVIHLCGSLKSHQDYQDDSEQKHKNSCSLSRSPSQLLIRADVHNTLDGKYLKNQHDESNPIDRLENEERKENFRNTTFFSLKDNIKNTPNEEENKNKQGGSDIYFKPDGEAIETKEYYKNNDVDQLKVINAETDEENFSDIHKDFKVAVSQTKYIYVTEMRKQHETEEDTTQDINLNENFCPVDEDNSCKQQKANSKNEVFNGVQTHRLFLPKSCENREKKISRFQSDILLDDNVENCTTSCGDFEEKFATKLEPTTNLVQYEGKLHLKSKIIESDSKSKEKDNANYTMEAGNERTKNNKEFVEVMITPSVTQRANSSAFTFTERLYRLDQEDTGSNEGSSQRPPAYKQRPTSWKMKSFLKKFDNLSSSKPCKIPPKPQCHRTGARESINRDLLQDAMKELDDYIDTEFEDECDEYEEQSNNTESEQSVTIESQTPKSSPFSGAIISEQGKMSDKNDNIDEVIEETIVRKEAPKAKLIPVENALMVLYRFDRDGEKVGEGNLSLEEKESAHNLSGIDGCKTILTASPPRSLKLAKGCETSDSKNIQPSLLQTNAIEESLLSDASKKNKIVCLEVNKLNVARKDIVQSEADVRQRPDVSNFESLSSDVPHSPFEAKVSVKENNPTKEEVEQSQIKGFYPEVDSNEKVDFGKNSLNQSNSAKDKAQPAAEHSNPPPIPMKKGREPLENPPLPPLFETKQEDGSEAQTVVDLGYEDVLDKLLDHEKSSEEKTNFATEANSEKDPKLSSSPVAKRFHFPWRKKSKDKGTKKVKPRQDTTKTQEIDTQDSCNQGKTKHSGMQALEDKKSQNSSRAGSKPQKKKRKDKTGKRRKGSEVEEKKKTNKEKNETEATREFPVDVYHEIEENSTTKEEINKTRTPKKIASTSTSASSSPFSSSPLSVDSSDESDYEPVNYVDSRDFKKANHVDVKKIVKSEDSNGYEIPAEKLSVKSRGRTGKAIPGEMNFSHSDQEQEEKCKVSRTSLNLLKSGNGDSSISNETNQPTTKISESNDAHSQPQVDSGGAEVIEPYLTFQYPKYLDDGEIYVGNPIAEVSSTPGTLQNIESNRSLIKVMIPSCSVQRCIDTENMRRNSNEFINEGNNIKKQNSKVNECNSECSALNTSKDTVSENKIDTAIPLSAVKGDLNMNSGVQSRSESNDASQETIPAERLTAEKKYEEMSGQKNRCTSVLSQKDCELLASPVETSSPELAVKSHISEALSKAFQDFDFGFDESGPVSDAETFTPSPKEDKYRVSSIQWEWRDPPETGSGGNKDSEKNRKLAVESSMDNEMPLAGIGASVVLDEVKSSFAEREKDRYDLLNNMDELDGTKSGRGETKSLSSDCSSVTASPPSSPVSDKTRKERSRLGKALAMRQVKSREKSKDKMKPRGVKRAKSKDKAKQKVSKDKDKSRDKKSEKSKSGQTEETNKLQEKINKKDSDEKDKWKWPWQRRGSKKEVASAAGVQSASESEDSETSKDGFKSNSKKEKKSVNLMRQSEQEDVPLHECNPCDAATNRLLESGINVPVDDHDYFNTFLDSTHCFQLPLSIESYINDQGKTEVKEIISGDTKKPSDLEDLNSKPISEKSKKSTLMTLKETEVGSTRTDQYKDAVGTVTAHLEVSGKEGNVHLAKDAPWSLFQVPSFQSSCSLNSEQPWKDYSPLELGKTQINSEIPNNKNPGPRKETLETEISANNHGDNDEIPRLKEYKMSDTNIEKVHQILSCAHQQKLQSAILPVTESENSAENLVRGDEVGHTCIKTVANQRAACRTASHPTNNRPSPVPKVRKTVRRHRSELATPDESFVVEFCDPWHSSACLPSGTNKGKKSAATTFSVTDIYPVHAKGCEINNGDNKAKHCTSVSPNVEDGDSRLTPEAGTLSSPMELKPKKGGISATLMDVTNSDLKLRPKVPPKPERKPTYTIKTEERSRNLNKDEEKTDTFPRQKNNSDDGEESEVEYDKLPVRQKKISSKLALQSFVLPVAAKNIVDERVVYTPVNRSPAQRLKSMEKTEYAAPWEESIQALTPTLPPRQYRR